jgi:hypothetical protein
MSVFPPSPWEAQLKRLSVGTTWKPDAIDPANPGLAMLLIKHGPTKSMFTQPSHLATEAYIEALLAGKHQERIWRFAGLVLHSGENHNTCLVS